jgi:restriction system protein
MWMVRAEGGALYDDFLAGGHVTIGGIISGDVMTARSRADVARMWQADQPQWSDRDSAGAGSVLYRFAHEICDGDEIVTYDPGSRIYAVGMVHGPYRYDPGRDEIIEGNPHPHIRNVSWTGEVQRDTLSQRARNTLGSISTLFAIKESVAAEILAIARGEAPPVTIDAAPSGSQPKSDESVLDSDEEAEAGGAIELSAAALEEQAMTGIADLVTAISPDDMEEFVAGLLRALGYHARVSPKGPDRGRDILATPDPLGLEDPRIHVEVKHRAGKASPGMIRSFLGGRGPGDRGIFVSTGGFTREARYEADRASIPVQLLDIEDLVRLLIENYSELKPDIARIVPLRRIWWPH